MIKDPNCKNKSWKIPEIDKMVEDEIFKLTVNKGYLEKLLNQRRKDTEVDNKSSKIIEQKISDIDKQINRLMDLYQVESMPVEEISKRIEKLYNEKKNLQGQLYETPKTPAVDAFNADGVRAILENLNYVWNYAEVEEKRNILKSLVNRIFIHDKGIKIEWSFL